MIKKIKRRPYKKRLKNYHVYGLVSQAGKFEKKLTKLISVEAEKVEDATKVGKNYAKMMGQAFSHVKEELL